jgi:ATP-dependent RNA helicase DeaD
MGATRGWRAVHGGVPTINAPVHGPATKFSDLGLRAGLQRTLRDLGYDEPTPIQRESIPPLLAGRDVLGQAATGTGKTAAFALPILQSLDDAGGNPGGRPVALILVPTRELALQVAEAVERYGQEQGARVVPVFGGQPIGRQLHALGRGSDVVVATPGRALDHLTRGSLRVDDVRSVVLDEADEMLDMGFADEIEAILSAAPTERQTILFSATMPTRITGIVRRHLRQPVTIEIERPAASSDIPPLVRQVAHLIARAHKPAALARVLEMEAPTAALVFCRTRDEVDEVTEHLNRAGHRAEALHGGMGQDQRDRVMSRLRARAADLVVATDVAARGLDIEQLTHVVNYDVPANPEAYVHRIGRVGRAGREGVAVTLTEPRQQHLLRTIRRVTGHALPIEPLPRAADLRRRRLDATTTALRDILLKADLSGFADVVAELTDEFDVLDVARAATKLAHEGRFGALPEADIPEVGKAGGRQAGPRSRSGSGVRATQAGSGVRATQAGSGVRATQAGSGVRATQAGARIFIGAGTGRGVRPKDLVGAITATSALRGPDIDIDRITDNFAIVIVPAPKADAVIAGLRTTTIRGHRPTIRRDRF